jgi:LmbE family N-acetylglucosaminyl deacetylase
VPTPPSSILFLHAHPDDECILTGPTLAKAAYLGLRTIVVYGTRGDAGETNADLKGESLGDRRVREATAACADLGVSRIEWLPYADSGMADTADNDNPEAFSNQAQDRVAEQLGDLLANESVAAVVGYDPNGTYGHPDHRQVHQVAHAAAGRLGAEWVLDATYNREHLAALPDSDGSLDPNFAAADADVTHFVTGDEWFTAKFKALANHSSQVPDDWDAENPDIEGFKARFGTEWFTVESVRGTSDLGTLSDLLEPKPD